jgi:hypothetical protein
MKTSRLLPTVCIVATLFPFGGCTQTGTPSIPPSETDTSAAGVLEPDGHIADAPDVPALPVDSTSADFEGTVGIVSEESSIQGAALLQNVRTARHDGYDRVVFEFSDAGLPGYHLEYIDRPVRACGSGEVVEIAGDGWLQVRLTPAHAHTEEGQPTVQEREQKPGLPNVLELQLTCDFEADVTWVLGTASPNRYRVLELSDPTRLVVDVRH